MVSHEDILVLFRGVGGTSCDKARAKCNESELQAGDKNNSLLMGKYSSGSSTIKLANLEVLKGLSSKLQIILYHLAHVKVQFFMIAP